MTLDSKFLEYALAVDDLQNLGLSLPEIRKVMKDAQLGNEEINSILTDRYVPFKPSQEKYLKLERRKIFLFQEVR